MDNLTFNCTHCGAPINYDGSDVPAIQCPFCNTTVVVPQELRPVKPPIIEIITPTYDPRTPRPTTGFGTNTSSNTSKVGWIIGIIIAFVVLCTLATTVGPLLVSMFVTNKAVSLVNSQVKSIATDVMAVSTSAPEPTRANADTPEPSPTPGYAEVKLTFGKAGINPGQFNNPRFIATDGTSTLYVTDYQGGRVQAFDLSGKYLTQWKAGDAKTIIEGLAADRKGGVYVSHDGYIYHYDGKTGDPLGKLSSDKGGDFGDLFMTPEGNLAAVWYEGRWGMITSLDGHSEALVIFSPTGKVLKTISSPISDQTGDPALDVFIAIDGKDNLYLLSDGSIYAFSPDGKYLNKFGSHGTDPGQLSSPSSIRVDDQGQLFIADSDRIDVFGPDGHFISSFQTEKSVKGMAYDDNGSLWVLTNVQVTQFVKHGE
ncbi:MAG TPA: NHL repeat-containing protein [Anaerolineaceae bacterium]